MAAATRYPINLTVSDGELSSTTSYTLNVQAKQTDGGQTGTYPTRTSKTKWKAGDIVNNRGQLFQCKPYPYSGWCNNAPSYYEQVKGLHGRTRGLRCNQQNSKITNGNLRVAVFSRRKMQDPIYR